MRRNLYFLSVLFFLAACVGGGGTPPTRYFVLDALTDAPVPAEKGREVAVAVEPVVLASYLDRPHMVTRNGKNELKLSEFNQWGESLRDNISRVLVENLSLLLNSEQVHLMPARKRFTPDFRLIVRVVHFEREETGKILLVVRWKLYGKDGEEVLFRETLRLFGGTVAEGDYPAMADQMSKVLGDFSRQVAARMNP